MLHLLKRWFARGCHLVAGAFFLAVCLVVGALGGLATSGGGWPYIMVERGFLTPAVAPGQPLQITRAIKYLDDCELHYEYRAQSKIGKRRAVIFPDVDYEHPPMDLDGLPKTSEYPIPPDMECGPAYLVESASVGCTWFQRKVRRLRKPDVFTDFEVVGCNQPPT